MGSQKGANRKHKVLACTSNDANAEGTGDAQVWDQRRKGSIHLPQNADGGELPKEKSSRQVSKVGHR